MEFREIPPLCALRSLSGIIQQHTSSNGTQKTGVLRDSGFGDFGDQCLYIIFLALSAQQDHTAGRRAAQHLLDWKIIQLDIFQKQEVYKSMERKLIMLLHMQIFQIILMLLDVDIIVKQKKYSLQRMVNCYLRNIFLMKI